MMVDGPLLGSPVSTAEERHFTSASCSNLTSDKDLTTPCACTSPAATTIKPTRQLTMNRFSQTNEPKNRRTASILGFGNHPAFIHSPDHPRNHVSQSDRRVSHVPSIPASMDSRR